MHTLYLWREREEGRFSGGERGGRRHEMRGVREKKNRTVRKGQ
jgi:hypothetical protein